MKFNRGYIPKPAINAIFCGATLDTLSFPATARQ